MRRSGIFVYSALWLAGTSEKDTDINCWIKLSDVPAAFENLSLFGGKIVEWHHAFDGFAPSRHKIIASHTNFRLFSDP